MGARQKLNQLHINGSLGLAAIVGWLGGSWLLFIVTATLLLALGCYCCEIRLGRQSGRCRDPRRTLSVSARPTRTERNQKGEVS